MIGGIGLLSKGGALAGLARGFMGSAGAKAGAKTGSKASSWGSDLQSYIAPAVGFATSNPMMVGAAIGGLGGFIGSGGEVSGTLMGAGLGAIGGRRGWTQEVGRSPTGITGALRKKAIGYVSKGARKAMPEASLALGGPVKSRYRTTGYSQQSRSRIQDYGPMTGHSRNIGSKRIGALGVGAGMMLGGGFAVGSMTSSAVNFVMSPRRSFGQQSNQIFGNSFSGMGNGAVSGY